jgi:hypothetical protein
MRKNVQKLYETGLQFDKLTDTQKTFFLEELWNGVGSRSYPIDPPDSIFKGPSIYHDFWYFRGGPDELRKMADLDFYYRCLDKIKERKKPLHKPFFYILAFIYYYGLKFLGKKAWEYHEKPAKTWDEFISRSQKFIN